tara:strand:+ start:46861 stop:47499 length:639 start_codon:yes stop_codon:yes gene_type:complete
MTFSIVARNPVDGSLGVATATAGPAVGALVPHVIAGVGAVATQAMTNPYLAHDCLARMPAMSAQSAMDAALAQDREPQRRQLIVVDRNGSVACWTGSACDPFAGHLAGKGFAVAGNILTGPGVLQAMLEAYEADAPFEQRLLAALAAGERAGGDARGTGSAALKVFGQEAFASIDLRVDWSEAPLDGLAALLERTTTGSYGVFFNAVPKRYS